MFCPHQIAALHDLGLAARYADRILLLANGEVAACRPAKDVLAQGAVAPVYRIATERMTSRCGHLVVVSLRRANA